MGVFGWFDRWGLDDILFIALDLAAGYLVHRITAALRWEQRAEKKKRGSGHQEDPEPAGCMEDFKPDWALAM